MPEFKLQSVHQNSGFPFTTLCAEHVGAEEGFIALYTCSKGPKLSFFLIGVIPRKQGLLKRLLRRDSGWKLGSLSFRFNGQLENHAELPQVLEALGFESLSYLTDLKGLPPVWFL